MRVDQWLRGADRLRWETAALRRQARTCRARISLALNPSGTVFIVDYNNNRVRLVDGNVHMQTFAGGGSGCPGQTDSVGDGCLATQATLNGPSAIAFDATGNAYIAEYGFVGNITPRIRMVSASTGIITTFAGTGVQGYSGDGGTGNQRDDGRADGRCSG